MLQWLAHQGVCITPVQSGAVAGSAPNYACHEAHKNKGKLCYEKCLSCTAEPMLGLTGGLSIAVTPESAPAPRAGASESSSSKNSTQGRARRALAKISRTCDRASRRVSRTVWGAGFGQIFGLVIQDRTNAAGYPYRSLLTYTRLCKTSLPRCRFDCICFAGAIEPYEKVRPRVMIRQHM